MPGPLVLAIPTFNSARFLHATLTSLASQGDSLRWWLQDGASTDGTPDIARQFARPTDTVVSQRDRGQPDALNHAFAQLGGDIIGFINGDDLLAPAAAATVLATFAAHPDIDLIYGEVQWIDINGLITGHHRGDISTLEELLDIYSVWYNARQWVQPEVFFRRSLWEKAGPFNVDHDMVFDYAFWVQCMQAGARVLRVPQVLAQFRLHPTQKSSNAAQAAAEIRDVVRAALALHPPIHPRVRARIAAQIGYDIYQLAPQPKPPFAQALLQHPSWLRSPAVRRRLLGSLTRKP